MVLIIESSDEQVLQAISDFARPFNVAVRRVNDASVVSQKERKRRLAIVRKFKGRLKKQSETYSPTKHDWYAQ